MSASVVIGITGGSGSGKSTLVRELIASIGASNVALLTQDDYYKPIEEQLRDEAGKVNFDLPEALDLKRFAADIDRLKAGQRISIEEYVFNQAGKTGQTRVIEPAELIIVEGLFLLCDPMVSKRIDHKVFVESDQTIQLERRIERDSVERGYPEKEVRYQWDNHVVPAYEQYLLPYRADCDLVIDNSGDKEEMLHELVDYLAIRVGLPIATAQLL